MDVMKERQPEAPQTTDSARRARVHSEFGLPLVGIDSDRFDDLLSEIAVDDVDWRGGRSWSLVYDSPDWHSQLVDAASGRFAHENGLSHTAFPSAARFESAVISMAASVMAPGVESFGIFASGGTECTMVALKAYRDRASGLRSNVVIPSTAHPAFGKAAAYLGLELRAVACDADGSFDLDAMFSIVDHETAVIGLSAPCYPFGVVDPIAEVGARAKQLGVGLHVDAALGGLFLPFLAEAGYPPVSFGLDVDGVTSVAGDLHKYGYGAKGASVLLFADAATRHCAYHVDAEWVGGAYASAGVLGTRPVGPAAAAFVAMAALGRSGYTQLVQSVMQSARRMQRAFTDSGALRIVGQPAMSVFAIAALEPSDGRSPELSIPSVVASLAQRGWWIDVQQPPCAMHFIVFPRHAAVMDQFVADIAASVREARDNPSVASETIASYGVMVRSSSTVSPSVLRDHLDARFDTSFDWRADT